MTKRSPTGAPPGSRAESQEARTARQAAALKANLQRRKVQARARSIGTDGHGQPGAATGDDQPPAGPHESAGIADNKRSS